MQNICTELRQFFGNMQIHAVCEYIKHDYIVLWLFISSSWLFHVFEQTPELLECDLAVPVGV